MKKLFGLVLLGAAMIALALLPPSASAAGKIGLGVYVLGDASGKTIDQYISMVGYTPEFAWSGTTWEDLNGNYIQFDPTYIDVFRTRGIVPGVTWEPSKGPAEQTGPNQPDFSWQQIIQGKHDAYIKQFAQAAAAYGYPFTIRVLHEMNGNWYPWGYGVNGNTNLGDAPTAWKHIVSIFRAAGATNVKFAYVISRNDQGFYNTYGKVLQQAYPGDSYVDWVGIDGYNKTESPWRSMQDVFQPAYNFLTGITTRPLMIFETGSIESSTDKMAKANWITTGYLTTVPTLFPRVQIVTWYDAVDPNGRDYTIDTSLQSLAAYQQVAANPLYQWP